MTIKDAQQAFAQAINEGRLSTDPAAPTWAGYYMYMGTSQGQDLFKHSLTREYLRDDDMELFRAEVREALQTNL
jgi:hypothetical protein